MKKNIKQPEPRKYADLTAQEKLEESYMFRQAVYFNAKEVQELYLAIESRDIQASMDQRYGWTSE